jgi:hypothetical protein
MKKSLWPYAYLTTNIIKKKIKKKLFKIKQKKKKGENCERLLSMNLSLSLSLSLSVCAVCLCSFDSFLWTTFTAQKSLNYHR